MIPKKRLAIRIALHFSKIVYETRTFLPANWESVDTHIIDEYEMEAGCDSITNLFGNRLLSDYDDFV